MKGKDILYTYLNTEEIERWFRNVGPEWSLYQLNADYDDLLNFIGSSFIFAATPEGFYYWDEVSHRTGMVKKSLPKFKL